MSGGVVVVVGNPQPGSRTAKVARRVGDRVAARTGLPEPQLIDLGADPSAVLDQASEQLATWRATVLGARALVVASPTYKATFTGLTKLFLDTFAGGELGGVPTFALMTGGSAHHSLAVQQSLVPVLVEIGASCPARGLYVCGPDIDDPSACIAEWEADLVRSLDRALRLAT